MIISIDKKDVAWGYIAMAFNYGTGCFTLPFILSMLSAQEVGLNYIMLTISSLVTLADFGFSQQIGRSITYVFSGAKSIEQEGFSSKVDSGVDYHLIATIIRTAKYLYLRIAIFVSIGMLTLGTLYVWNATNGFTLVENSLYIWLLFTLGTFFAFYFKYYTTLLLGAAQLKEYNKGVIYTKMLYIIIVLSMLFLGCGLISVVVANLIAPFLQRWLSYHWFYTKEITNGISGQYVTPKEISETFNVLWYNAKKLGSIFIAQYGISQSGIFLCGLKLPLEVIASYGLLMQLVNNILCNIAKNLFNTLSPLFYKDVVKGDHDALIRHFSLGNFVFWILFISGGIAIVILGPWALNLFGSNSQLPSIIIMTIFITDALLDYNHANFTYIPQAWNSYPYLKADVMTGIAVVLVNCLTLFFTDWGLLGVVCGRFLCLLVYNDWKWPDYASKMLNTPLSTFAKVGYKELCLHVQKNINRITS